VNVTAVKRRLPDRKRRKKPIEQAAGQATPLRRRLHPWQTRTLITLVVALLLGGGLLIWSRPWRATAPTQGYTISGSYPHSVDAYCQGLVYHGGFLYEGTGGYDGESRLRKVELQSGRVLQEHQLDGRLFGEGITIWDDKIIQLTWRSQLALVYDRGTFEPVGRFDYRGEGWGLTHDGTQLIMSDGSATLRFLDPTTFQIKRRLTVRDGRRRITNLNELEYVEGEIYANIWYDDRIVRISPQTGRVLGWLDMSRLYPRSQRPDRDAVLNGIAYDPEQRRLLVTGKNWPRLFEIRLPAPERRDPR
jgi:glutamine cyclotransferase